MKNTRTMLVLGIAIMSGLVAVLLASRWLTQQTSNGVARVVVASTDISLGQRLTPELFKLVDWPTESTPPGVFNDISKLDGRVVKTSLMRGEPVLEGKLAPLGTKGGLSAVIGEGRRAITVRVNDVIGVAGFALPGNFVDIIVNTQKEGERNGNTDQNISKIVLERILVLAVAQEVGRDETKPRVVNAVTLEVTPDQAEKLDLARSVGTLSLALRNQIDPQPGTTLGATKASLLEPRADTKVAAIIAAKPAQSGKTSRSASSSYSAKNSLSKHASSSTRNTDCIGVITGLHNTQECY
jgi:pilus assembly protein CpaB